jgi:DNA-binding ferritin-like protein (Dps family)
MEFRGGSGSNNETGGHASCQEIIMDFLESRREAAERLQRYAASRGVDLATFRDEHDVFSSRKRWIDFWLDGAAVGYHLRGEIGKLPRQFAASQSSFRGVWDEAGSVNDLHQALELLRSWLIDAKEVDELTGRMVHRSMM